MFALGRLPHDPEAYAATTPIPDHHLMAVAGSDALVRPDWRPCLGHNDSWPTCTTTGLANAARMVEIANGGDLALDDDRMAEKFSVWTGIPYTPEAMAASSGARLLDILDHQAAEGFDIGTPTPLVALWGRIGHDRVSLARSIRTFGHAYLGVDLHQRDVEGHILWDAVDGRDDGPVVGGHCICPYDFTGLGDTDTVRIATWGFLMPATWAWVEARILESYALAWRQLALPGVDFDALERELRPS